MKAKKQTFPQGSIGSSKAGQWIGQLKTPEIKWFKGFVQSFLGSKRKSSAQLLDGFIHEDFKPEMSKEAFFKLIYPASNFSKDVLRKELGFLMQDFKQFLIYLELQQNFARDPDLEAVHYLKGLTFLLREDKMENVPLIRAEYEKEFHKLRAKLQKEENFDLLFEIETLYSIHSIDRSVAPGEFHSYADWKIESLDRAFYLSRLKDSCSMLENYLQGQDNAYNPAMVQQSRELGKLLFPDGPENRAKGSLIQIYEIILELLQWRVYHGLDGHLPSQTLQKITDMVLADTTFINNDPILWLLFNNILATQINRGVPGFRETYFDLHSELLTKHGIPNDMHVPARYLKSIVLTGYRSGEKRAEKADKLLEIHKRKIDLFGKDRASFYNLCKAWKYFYDGYYAMMYDFAKDAQFSDPSWQILLLELRFKAAFSIQWTSEATRHPEMDPNEENTALFDYLLSNPTISESQQFTFREREYFYRTLVELNGGELSPKEFQEKLGEYYENLDEAGFHLEEIKWLREMGKELEEARM